MRTAASCTDGALDTTHAGHFAPGLQMFLATLVTEMMVNSSWKETSHKYSCGSFSNLSEAAVCSSPSPSAGSHSAAVSPSAEAHVMICGSQDWLATWGRHWEMTRGPVGVWLSRQSPLTRCCRTEPLGFHFCGGGKKKRKRVRCATAFWFPFTAHKPRVWTDGSRRVMPLDHCEERLTF